MPDKPAWKCHVCGKERPDDRISVFSQLLMMDGMEIGKQSFRYCNDKDACRKGVRTFDFINTKFHIV